MHYSYKTKNICSQQIDFDLDNGIIHNVRFFGGCPGNLKAISILVEGKHANEIIPLLRNVDCGGKGTSCSAQFAAALSDALNPTQK